MKYLFFYFATLFGRTSFTVHEDSIFIHDDDGIASIELFDNTHASKQYSEYEEGEFYQRVYFRDLDTTRMNRIWVKDAKDNIVDIEAEYDEGCWYIRYK